MSNHKKYKQAFSTLHASDSFSLEVEKMAMMKRKQLFKNVAAAVAICVLLVGAGGTAYAADLGGIQRKIQLWIHGDQTDATIEFDSDGTYQMQYTDEDGNIQERGGGGVALDNDGIERPLTEEELMEGLNSPDVVYKDDGTVWVYYYDQKVEITDKFNDDVCYVKLLSEDKTLYMTVKYQNGYATSESSYISPYSFNL